MPIRMLLTLLASLCILQTILLNSQPIIPSSDDLQRESPSSDVTPANAFMELPHDAGTLMPTYTSEDWWV